MKVPALESVFLNRSPRPEQRDFSRVLVLGGDGTAARLAERLSAEGYQVTILGSRDAVGIPTGIVSLPDTVLEQVHGFLGCFDTTLRSPEGERTEHFGFLVAAQPAEQVAKFAEYGLIQSERVVSLSQLEAALDAQRPLVQARGDWFHAAFLCGLEGGADPTVFARAFAAIDRLRQREQVQCYVFTSHVKVAAPGLEKRYRQIREEGTLFFKFDGAGLSIEEEEGRVVIVFFDPVLGAEMELVPDLLVVDEHLQPSAALKPLLDAIPSSLATAPFLKPDSTRFSGVTTAKAGVFALGAARGNFGVESAAGEAEALLTAMKTSAREEIRTGLPETPSVDPAKCTICLTCVRLCPHGAMSFGKRAEADPASCLRCGICAAECPMDAIRLSPPAGEPDLRERITQGLAQATSSPRIVAFLCSRSAAQAMESAGPAICQQITPHVVPCAGTIDPAHILTAFQDGADGVLVAGCHTGNCASIYGTVLASGRVSQAALILEEAGLDPRRLMFTTLASNTPTDFARAVHDLRQNLLNRT